MLSRTTRRTGHELAGAARRRNHDGPLTIVYPDIRRRCVRDSADQHPAAGGGARLVGHKVGLSSEMQKMMGVEARLRALALQMECFRGPTGGRGAPPVPRLEVGWPSFWPTICPAPAAPDDVPGRTAAFAPSIEIITPASRTGRSRPVCDTIADNASSGGFVLGREQVFARTSTSTRSGGAVPDSEVGRRGRNDAVLGNPTSPRWRGYYKGRQLRRATQGRRHHLAGSCGRSTAARRGFRRRFPQGGLRPGSFD